MQLLFLALLLLLASCGRAPQAPEGDNKLDLPVPSGPPVAQQAEAVPSSAPAGSGSTWESAASGEGLALRLTAADGSLLLSIACLGEPRRLVVGAPGFKAIGSEDRFSLGLGAEPVTLVADPTRQGRTGVTAEGALPEGFGKLLGGAEQVGALYGSQQIGPHAAPVEALKEALAKACASPK